MKEEEEERKGRISVAPTETYDSNTSSQRTCICRVEIGSVAWHLELFEIEREEAMSVLRTP